MEAGAEYEFCQVYPRINGEDTYNRTKYYGNSINTLDANQSSHPKPSFTHHLHYSATAVTHAGADCPATNYCPHATPLLLHLTPHSPTSTHRYLRKRFILLHKTFGTYVIKVFFHDGAVSCSDGGRHGDIQASH